MYQCKWNTLKLFFWFQNLTDGNSHTFSVHEIACWEDSENVGYVSPVGQHSDLAVLPSKHHLRGLCDGSPRVPDSGLQKAGHAEHPQNVPSPPVCLVFILTLKQGGSLVRWLGTVIMLDYGIHCAIHGGSIYFTYRHGFFRICADVNCLEPAFTCDIMCYIVLLQKRTQTGWSAVARMLFTSGKHIVTWSEVTWTTEISHIRNVSLSLKIARAQL